MNKMIKSFYINNVMLNKRKSRWSQELFSHIHIDSSIELSLFLYLVWGYSLSQPVVVIC